MDSVRPSTANTTGKESSQSEKVGVCDQDAEDDLTASTDYQTLSANASFEVDLEEETTAITDYETISNDLGGDAHSDDLSNSLAECGTISPDFSDYTDNAEEQSSQTGDYECKICIRRYPSLQECLRHELLEHNKKTKSPQKSVQTKLKHMQNALKRNKPQVDRALIHEILKNCKPGLELQEIFKFYCISDEKVKELTTTIRTCLLMNLYPSQNVRIYTFGSCENGLMLYGSDIDLYISMIFPNDRVRKAGLDRQIYKRVNNNLHRSRYFDEVVAIRRARIPIIKCRHRDTGMRIDINCSNPNSTLNTEFTRMLLEFDVRLRSLMRFLKIWAKQMWLLGPGQMTSYCLTTLILFYLQQPIQNRNPLVPSIQELQFGIHPKLVNGINYAFDLYRRMRPLPINLSTSTLIRNFFSFYRQFDFTNNMIAPYLGVALPLADFKTGNFQYTAYVNQMSAMKAESTADEVIEELNIDLCMVVQDPFQLNQNVARSVSFTHFEYFRKCIEYSYQICNNHPEITRNDRDLYEALLFDVRNKIENEVRELQKCVGRTSCSMQPHELTYSFSPCRAEIRALSTLNLQQKNTATAITDANNHIYQQWLHIYVEVIFVILRRIYCLDVELLPEITENTGQALASSSCDKANNESSILTNSIKQLDEKGELTWLITGSTDLWSNRQYQRQVSQSFMAYQQAQTDSFLIERQGKALYQVKLRGHFIIKPQASNKALDIIVRHEQLTQGVITKKGPLRKFFTNFKCSMQNFNLKEKIQIESGRKSQKLDESECSIWKIHGESQSNEQNGESS